jgi:hypothetical protein
VRNHPCNLCDAAFYSHTYLAQHVIKAHGSNWNGVTQPAPQNLIGCVICGQGFETKNKMLQHIINHRADRSATKEQILKVFDEHLNFEEPIFVIEEEP